MALITAESVLKTLEDAVVQINIILADFDDRIKVLEKPAAKKTTPKDKSNDS